MKKATLALITSAVLLLGARTAHATSTTYDLSFFFVYDRFGSGTGVFDDTPAGPGSEIAGSTRYNFTSFVGNGPTGSWTSSFLEYNSGTGEGRWRWVAGADTSSVTPSFPPGLSPTTVLEQAFAALASQGYLTVSLRSGGNTVPETGGTLSLLALGLLGLPWCRRWCRFDKSA